MASTEKVSLSVDHDALVLARRATAIEGLSLSAYMSRLARLYAWASERPRSGAAEQADADIALTDLDERELCDDGPADPAVVEQVEALVRVALDL